MEFINIVYRDNSKLTIPETLCSNFKEVKKWVDDFNDGLNPKMIFVNYRDKPCLRAKDIISAKYEVQDVICIWN